MSDPIFRVTLLKSTACVVCLASLFGATPARASWFEFCDIQGVVRQVEHVGDSTMRIVVDVTQASRSRGALGRMSYIDCSEYVGRPLDADFDSPRRNRLPSVGDLVSFSRSAIDTFNAQGEFAGTTVTIRSLEVLKRRKGKSAPGQDRVESQDSAIRPAPTARR